MNKNENHLIPEIVINICESFQKAWLTDHDKVNLYHRLEIISKYIQDVLQKNVKYKK